MRNNMEHFCTLITCLDDVTLTVSLIHLWIVAAHVLLLHSCIIALTTLKLFLLLKIIVKCCMSFYLCPILVFMLLVQFLFFSYSPYHDLWNCDLFISFHVVWMTIKLSLSGSECESRSSIYPPITLLQTMSKSD